MKGGMEVVREPIGEPTDERIAIVGFALTSPTWLSIDRPPLSPRRVESYRVQAYVSAA